MTAKIAGDKSVFLLGNREIADDGSDIDVYPESSPLGQAILGLKAGDKVSYQTPAGKDIAVEIIGVSTYAG